MRYVRFSLQDDQVQTGFLTADDRVVPVGALDPALRECTMTELLEYAEGDQDKFCALKRNAETIAGHLLNEVKLHAPIERPKHDILCVGVNYADHLKETQEHSGGMNEKPAATVYFSKRALQILGTEDVLEANFELDEALDYEVELAVIIGKSGRRISPEEARKHIFGYSVFNDLSSRNLQFKHVQWFLGKSVDGYTAMGPWIVDESEIEFPPKLEVKSYVNGELRQHSNTEYFIQGVAEMISEISQSMTLECGDIIATGTPAGVGFGFQPPRYMKSGDQVVCEIDQIGLLKTYIK